VLRLFKKWFEHRRVRRAFGLTSASQGQHHQSLRGHYVGRCECGRIWSSALRDSGPTVWTMLQCRACGRQIRAFKVPGKMVKGYGVDAVEVPACDIPKRIVTKGMTVTCYREAP